MSIGENVRKVERKGEGEEMCREEGIGVVERAKLEISQVMHGSQKGMRRCVGERYGNASSMTAL